MNVPLKLAWYRSRVIVGALVALVFLLLDRFNVAHGFLPEDQAAIVELILLLTGAAGAGVAIHARVTQEAAPPIGGSTIVRLPALAAVLAAALALSACADVQKRIERAGRLTAAACRGILAEPVDPADQEVGLFCRRVVELAPLLGMAAALLRAAAEAEAAVEPTVPTQG